MRISLFVMIAGLVLGVAGLGSAWAEDKDTELKAGEARLLGHCAAQRIDQGGKEEDVEKGIRDDLQGIRDGWIKEEKEEAEDKDRDDKDKDKGKGPGEALKHGLSDKGAENLGRFVNEQLARGLRGKDLAGAIHRELQVRHEAREAARASRREGGHEEHPTGRPHGGGGPRR